MLLWAPLYLKNYLQSKQVTVRDSLGPSDMIRCHRTRSSLGQVMACCLFGAKPLPEPSLTSCQLDPKEQTPRWNFDWNSNFLIEEKAFETMVCKLATILFRPQCTGIILCMRPGNGRRRYNVTSSLIGWTHTQNNPRMYQPINDQNNVKSWGSYEIYSSIHDANFKILCL